MKRPDNVTLIAGIIGIVLVATGLTDASVAAAQPSDIGKAAAEPIMTCTEASRRRGSITSTSSFRTGRPGSSGTRANSGFDAPS